MAHATPRLGEALHENIALTHGIARNNCHRRLPSPVGHSPDPGIGTDASFVFRSDMIGGDESRVLAEARRHHRKQVNDLLRRPGLYGREEIAELLVLGAMAAVDDSSARWDAELGGLRERRAVTATGVKGAYGKVLPPDALRSATASLYAGIAHRCGWLDLDRTLPAAEYRRMATGIGDWVAKDRTLSQVLDDLGDPSLWIGGSNRLWPKTLCYTTANPDDDLICVHLWNAAAEGRDGVHPEPIVLAVRHRPGDFPDAFSFAPEGLRRRPI